MIQRQVGLAVANAAMADSRFSRSIVKDRGLKSILKNDYDRLFKLDSRELYRQHFVPRIEKWQTKGY